MAVRLRYNIEILYAYFNDHGYGRSQTGEIRGEEIR